MSFAHNPYGDGKGAARIVEALLNRLIHAGLPPRSGDVAASKQ